MDPSARVALRRVFGHGCYRALFRGVPTINKERGPFNATTTAKESYVAWPATQPLPPQPSGRHAPAQPPVATRVFEGESETTAQFKAWELLPELSDSALSPTLNSTAMRTSLQMDRAEGMAPFSQTTSEYTWVEIGD